MANEKTITFPVEATHIMMFARAIGDTNPIYHDAEAAAATPARGIIAPPTFLQAVVQFDPDFQLRPQADQPWFGSGANPSGVEGKPASSGGLHAEQHFEYFRPVRPGDVLTVTQHEGKRWEKDSRRGGKLQFVERIVEYCDPEGELVCRVRSVSVKTESPVEQG